LAAYLGSSLCAELTLFVRQRHRLVCSDQVLREFADKLKVKFKASASVTGAWVAQIRVYSQVQTDPLHAPKRSRDPKDDRILQAALDADCDWLVSGDSDLTSLKRVKGMPITTPRDFLEAMGVEESFS
jgi:uncharacterized protein